MMYELIKILTFFLKCVFTILALIAITIFMASLYNDAEFYAIPCIALIVGIVIYLLSKILRQKFQNMSCTSLIDYQEKIGSVIYTEKDKTGFYPYRKISFGFNISEDVVSEIYYIDDKIRKKLYLLHSLTVIFVLLLITQMGNDRYNPYITESYIIFLFLGIILIFTSRIIRNYILEKYGFYQSVDKINK